MKTDSAAQLLAVVRQMKALTEQKSLLEKLVFADHGESKKTITIPGEGKLSIIEESISESLDLVSSIAQILDLDLSQGKSRSAHLAIIENELARQGLQIPKKITIRKSSIRVTVNS